MILHISYQLQVMMHVLVYSIRLFVKGNVCIHVKLGRSFCLHTRSAEAALQLNFVHNVSMYVRYAVNMPLPWI